VELTQLPDEPGPGGTVEFDLAADTSLSSAFVNVVEGDRLKGTAEFEQCDAVAKRPSIAATTFTEQAVHIEEKSVFPDDPPDIFDITMAMPEGRPAGQTSLGSPAWTAPDGRTQLSLSLSTPAGDFVESSASWAKMQVEAFAKPPNIGELVSGEAKGEGTYSIRWRHRYEEGPWTNQIVVFRQEEGWEHQVTCQLNTDDTGLAEVGDAVQAACEGLSAP
jgi:hypothetical protein